MATETDRATAERFIWKPEDIVILKRGEPREEKPAKVEDPIEEARRRLLGS